MAYGKRSLFIKHQQSLQSHDVWGIEFYARSSEGQWPVSKVFSWSLMVYTTNLNSDLNISAQMDAQPYGIIILIIIMMALKGACMV